MARTHGIQGTYAAGCRCAPCRLAHRAAFRQSMERARARFALDPTIAPHGRLTTYNYWGCRCTPCTDARRQRR